MTKINAKRIEVSYEQWLKVFQVSLGMLPRDGRDKTIDRWKIKNEKIS